MKVILIQKLFLAGLALGLSVISYAQAPIKDQPTRRVKLIEAGWERPSSSDLLEHLKIIEQTPYDGIVVMLVGKDDEAKDVVMQSTFTQRPWKREWFAKNIEELKAAKSEKLTDNFVRIGTNPGNVDWFDDAGWKQVVDHWRIIAWVARQGGLKGILFDPEPYSKPYFQLNYNAQAGKSQHTFAEYQAKARQRGREIMQVLGEEYPDMTLFTFFMNSVNMSPAAQTNPQKALENASYNLYPAFINGWLDVAPPTITFVDGNEPAYHYKEEIDFLRGANGMRNTVLSLVAPENHGKYKKQVQAGFAFYLDAYVNPETSRYYIPPLDGSRTARLQANLGFGAQATDQYLWTWGEKYRWWPTKTSSVNPQYWDEVLPGASDALRGATNPGYALKKAAERFAVAEKNGAVKNLIRNGDFSVAAGPATADSNAAKLDWKAAGAPAGWNVWKRDLEGQPPGVFALDADIDHTGKAGNGSARLSGMNEGTFISSTPVEAGKYYMIRAWQRFNTPNGAGAIRIRWQNANGQWSNVDQDGFISVLENAAPGTWHLLSGVIQVPTGVAKLIVLLGAANQSSPQATVWYDDVQVYEIP